MVQRGVILGTAAYVSPEQARGREADRRSDIWAFGAVLYEMLSGRRAFQGDDVADTIAAVLRQDVDWSALDASTPAPVRRLLARCLDRDTRRRLRDIGEARILLEDPAARDRRGRVAPGGRSGRAALAPPPGAAAAAIVAGAAVGAALRPRTRSTATHVTRFALSTTAATALRWILNLATSPSRPTAHTSSTKVGAGVDGTRLFVRGLGQLDPTPLTAPGRPKGPFASPDGQWVGFFEPGAGGVALKKVATHRRAFRGAVPRGWPEPRRHLGRRRHHHPGDGGAVHRPAACLVGGRCARRADDARPRARGKRSHLAAVPARQPRRPVHDHGPERGASMPRRWPCSTWRPARGRRWFEAPVRPSTYRAGTSCTWRPARSGPSRSTWREWRRPARPAWSCRKS